MLTKETVMTIDTATRFAKRFVAWVALLLIGVGAVNWAATAHAAPAVVFIGEDDQGGGGAVHRWNLSGPGDATGSNHVSFGTNRASGLAFSSAVSPNELFMGSIQAGGVDIKRSINAFSATPTFDSARDIGPGSFDPIANPVNVGDGSGDLYVGGSGIGGGNSKDLKRITPTATGATTVYSTSTGSPNGSRGVAVSPWGEVFYADFAPGNIRRFTDDGTGFTSNGLFDSGGNSPHGMVFIGNELFVANVDSVNVARFTFTSNDASGTAVPNGTITGNGLQRPIGLAVAPWDELWVVNQGLNGSGNPLANGGSASRFTFDGAGNAVANGEFIFNDPGAFGGIGIAFIPEPSGFVLAILGTCGLYVIRLRRGRRFTQNL
jgi:hypothetical protein